MFAVGGSENVVTVFSFCLLANISPVIDCQNRTLNPCLRFVYFRDKRTVNNIFYVFPNPKRKSPSNASSVILGQPERYKSATLPVILNLRRSGSVLEGRVLNSDWQHSSRLSFCERDCEKFKDPLSPFSHLY